MEVINLDSVDLSGGGPDTSIKLNKGDSIDLDISNAPSLTGVELLMNQNVKIHHYVNSIMELICVVNFMIVSVLK